MKTKTTLLTVLYTLIIFLFFLNIINTIGFIILTIVWICLLVGSMILFTSLTTNSMNLLDEANRMKSNTYKKTICGILTNVNSTRSKISKDDANYEIIDRCLRQIENNCEAAIDIINNTTYNTNPEVDSLLSKSNVLFEKVQKLITNSILVNKSVKDVETDSIDDLIASLDELIND